MPKIVFLPHQDLCPDGIVVEAETLSLIHILRALAAGRGKQFVTHRIVDHRDFSTPFDAYGDGTVSYTHLTAVTPPGGRWHGWR